MNKWFLAFVCLFGGICGIHRFMVGKIGSGIAYLCTGAWCGIGWLIDLCSIVRGNFTDQFGNRIL